ncbi:MAG: bifunctional folylpolyglutamate synthase/ dihydrofolate synthase [Desulfovibrio sp.]|nr:bifunctional folylpolyglutamate synthase/ dihydrofolate synthase [Desulfovibrio sp.]
MQRFQCLDELWAFLAQRGLFHIDLELTRMERALEALALAPLPCVIQVLGTNGKGSTSVFLTSLCRAHGLSCGLYTSPHFVSPKERIRAFPEDFTDAAWLEAANKVLAVDCGLTYFEFMTLLALVLMCQSQVQVAVLEAGLGGAHDATTACRRDILCYTPIALDHCQILGDSLAAIASDKAQAMASGQLVFSAPQYPCARTTLMAMAEKRGATLHLVTASERYDGPLGLLGSHQQQNASLALAAFSALAERLGIRPDKAKIQKGLAQAFLPGRLQRLCASAKYPALIVDGAHNPHGLQTMLRSLAAADISPQGLVFACLADKDWLSLVRLLKQSFPHLPVHFPSLQNPRALAAEQLAACWGQVEQATSWIGLSVVETLRRLASEENGPYLLTGSLYLLAEFFAAYPAALEPV